jgi:peroxisomal 3,2-trans-enoyl-CoA isomerase
MKLALCPEGTSSYMFPFNMSSIRANELLLLGKEWTAQEALRANLVNEVFPSATLMQEVEKVAIKLSNHPQEALRQAKQVHIYLIKLII